MLIRVESTERVEVLDVTQEVSDSLPDDVKDGVCTVFVPHTTAGVVVNESEARLLSDVEQSLDCLIPREEAYEHDEIDDNAAAHIRAIVLGESASIPIRDGELAHGTWQSVLFVECDGPRTRSIEVVATSAE
jgi:secondary thiamine-phosphate synthase enzyme